MNKLVKLLNKFEKEKIINEWWYVDEDDEYFWRSIEDWEVVNWSYDRDAHWFFKYYIISKEFKFIERLVENNKIKEEEFSWFLYWPDYISDLSNSIIAWLSISDTPIDDLIKLLK